MRYSTNSVKTEYMSLQGLQGIHCAESGKELVLLKQEKGLSPSPIGLAFHATCGLFNSKYATLRSDLKRLLDVGSDKDCLLNFCEHPLVVLRVLYRLFILPLHTVTARRLGRIYKIQANSGKAITSWLNKS